MRRLSEAAIPGPELVMSLIPLDYRQRLAASYAGARTITKYTGAGIEVGIRSRDGSHEAVMQI
jgi:hypothetical protein